jgi:hypothetical protein
VGEDMATTYSVRELYGGAIAVELPTEFIDSRYVPFPDLPNPRVL